MYHSAFLRLCGKKGKFNFLFAKKNPWESVQSVLSVFYFANIKNLAPNNNSAFSVSSAVHYLTSIGGRGELESVIWKFLPILQSLNNLKSNILS